LRGGSSSREKERKENRKEGIAPPCSRTGPGSPGPAVPWLRPRSQAAPGGAASAVASRYRSQVPGRAQGERVEVIFRVGLEVMELG